MLRHACAKFLSACESFTPNLARTAQKDGATSQQNTTYSPSQSIRSAMRGPGHEQSDQWAVAESHWKQDRTWEIFVSTSRERARLTSHASFPRLLQNGFPCPDMRALGAFCLPGGFGQPTRPRYPTVIPLRCRTNRLRYPRRPFVDP